MRLHSLLLTFLLSMFAIRPQPVAAQVTDLDRNFSACKYGTAACNSSLLTAAQAETARQAALDRNFSACRYGTAACNDTLLSDVQAAIVRQAARERNFSACRYGTTGCNPALLTEAQTTALAGSGAQGTGNAVAATTGAT